MQRSRHIATPLFPFRTLGWAPNEAIALSGPERELVGGDDQPDGAKITGSIASNMPAGLTLSATLGAPAGATSAGIKALSTVATDLVTAITKLNASALSLTYQLDATAAAGVVTSSSRLVTFTITGGV